MDMQSLADGLPHDLRFFALNAYDCSQLGDATLSVLAAKIKDMSQLKRLELRFINCLKMTDDGVQQLFLPDKCDELILNFTACGSQDDKAITDMGVQHLAQQLSQLKELKLLVLYLADIPHLTIASLNSLLEAVQDLKQLHTFVLEMRGTKVPTPCECCWLHRVVIISLQVDAYMVFVPHSRDSVGESNISHLFQESSIMRNDTKTSIEKNLGNLHLVEANSNARFNPGIQ